MTFTIDDVTYDKRGAENTGDEGTGSMDGKLVVTMDGFWQSGEKQNYVDALTILGSNSTAIEKSVITNNPTNPRQGQYSGKTGTFYSAMDG